VGERHGGVRPELLGRLTRQLVCSLVVWDARVPFNPGDVYLPPSPLEVGDPLVNAHCVLLSRAGSSAACPRDCAGGAGVGDQGVLSAREDEPQDGLFYGCDFGVEGRLAGAQGFALIISNDHIAYSTFTNHNYLEP